MHFTATLKQGPVYARWMRLNKHGGSLHGTDFTLVGRGRDAIFVADTIHDLDTIKNDPDVVVEMTGILDPPKQVRIETVHAPIAIKPEPVRVGLSGVVGVSMTDETERPRRGRPPKVKDE